MAALNKVQIIGNLGKDPETKAVGQSTVANFSVAVTERYKDRDGNQQESTEWFSVQAWGKLADICAKYLTKGSPVYIEGKLRTRSWDDSNGQKQYRTELVAETLQMLGQKSQGGDSHGAPPPRTQSAPSQQQHPEDDLPF